MSFRFMRAMLLMAVISLISGCTREQETSPAVNTVVSQPVNSVTTVFATIGAEEKPYTGGTLSDHARDSAPLQKNETFHIVFDPQGNGAAYLAQQGSAVHVVHNGRKGKPYSEIDPNTLAISPNGLQAAYGARIGDAWWIIVDGKEVGPYREIGPPVFSPDGKHIAYEAKIGESWHICVDGNRSPGWGSYYAKPVFSADSTKVLYIENTDGKRKRRVVVADRTFSRMIHKESSGYQLRVNTALSAVAVVSLVNEKKRVVEFPFEQPDKDKEGILYDAITHLAFGPDGRRTVYVAERDSVRFLVTDGREELLPEGGIARSPVMRPDHQGVGIILADSGGMFLHEAFLRGGKQHKRYEEIDELTYSSNGVPAYAARTGSDWRVVVNGRESALFDRVVTPLFSPDGRHLVYRARKDGKRFVVVADTQGKIVRRHPAYEQVFQPVFTSEGQSVAYGVLDGKQIVWKVEKLQ